MRYFKGENQHCEKGLNVLYGNGTRICGLSDLICIENSLSVIDPKPYAERAKENRYKDSVSKRDLIRKDIDLALLQKPSNLEILLKILHEQGYEIKYGKRLSLRKKDDEGRFVRLSSLGEGYTEDDLNQIFEKGIRVRKKKKGYQRGLSLLIDIQEKIREGKGGGYTHWAKVFNVKQMAQTILFLQEHEFESFEQLDQATNEIIKRFHEAAEQLKSLDIGTSKGLKQQIIQYSKTRETYVEYRKSGYSKHFLEMHREAIESHKAAKQSFDKLGVPKNPRVKELNQQISESYDKRKSIMEEYYQLKEEMRKMTVVRENVNRILNEKMEQKEYVLGK